MIEEIRVPEDLWEGDYEGLVLGWARSDGDVVEQGERLVELMVEKVQFELTAPASGRLSILAPPETVIRKGQVLGRIEPVAVT